MPRVLLVLALAITLSAPASSAVAQTATCTRPGAVVQLMGTPHLFIADAQGILHWGGDTRGLAGRAIDWNIRCEVGLSTLQAMPRGDPWLSAGLPQVGEPIYQAKWEDTEVAPRLLHIQSIADVELFGINTANYLNFVLDRATWQQRFGFDVGNLQVGPLAAAASYAWSTADRASYAQLLTNMENVESAALFRATSAGIDAAMSLPRLADCERRGLDSFDRDRNAGRAVGVTQDCINQLTPGGPTPTPTPGPSTGVPRPPTNVQVSLLSSSQVRITWTDTQDETGYRIYEFSLVGTDAITQPAALIATVPQNVTVYDRAGRTIGLNYCYSVSAFNSVGESSATGPVCTSGSQTGAPSAPANLRVTPQQDGIRLDWFDTSSNEEGFRILRGSQVVTTVPPGTTSFLDFVTPGTSTCYTVVAYNSAGQAPSNQACPGGSTSSQPSAPLNLTLTPLGGGNVYQLSWADTSNNEDGFRILRGNQIVTTLPANTTSFVDGGIVPGQGCYTVVAFNSFGQASSNQACPGF